MLNFIPTDKVVYVVEPAASSYNRINDHRMYLNRGDVQYKYYCAFDVIFKADDLYDFLKKVTGQKEILYTDIPSCKDIIIEHLLKNGFPSDEAYFFYPYSLSNKDIEDNEVAITLFGKKTRLAYTQAELKRFAEKEKEERKNKFIETFMGVNFNNILKKYGLKEYRNSGKFRFNSTTDLLNFVRTQLEATVLKELKEIGIDVKLNTKYHAGIDATTNLFDKKDIKIIDIKENQD